MAEAVAQIERTHVTRDATRTRAAILDAAQRLFAAEGFVAAGVHDIAAAAGVNSALVCRYFG